MKSALEKIVAEGFSSLKEDIRTVLANLGKEENEDLIKVPIGLPLKTDLDAAVLEDG